MLVYQCAGTRHYYAGIASRRIFIERTSTLSFVTAKILYSRSASGPPIRPRLTTESKGSSDALLNVISQTGLPSTVEDSISSSRIFAVRSGPRDSVANTIALRTASLMSIVRRYHRHLGIKKRLQAPTGAYSRSGNSNSN